MQLTRTNMAATKIKNRQIEITTDFDIGSNKLTNVSTPTSSTDAATKAYVDQVAAGLRDPKDSARVATTANITLSGTQTIDSVALSVGERVLVKNQSTASENGIYVVASGAWARSTDADSDAEVTSGMSVYVSEGTVGGGKTYVLSTPDPISLGATNLTFVQTGGSSATQVVRETPSGSVNGANTDFTLANTPISNSESVYLNGLLQDVGAGNDYTISGAVITFLTAPVSGDKIRVTYNH